LECLIPQIAGRPNRELVVVNDGTHSGAYHDVVAPFEQIIRYEVLPQPLGIARARNRSVELSSGEFLVFTDDDCEVPPHWLDWLEASLNSHPELDVVAGATRPLRPEEAGLVGQVQGAFELLPAPHTLGGLDECFVTACLAVRRSTFESVGGFSEGSLFAVAGEDTDLSLRLIRARARTRVDTEWHVFHSLARSLRAEMRRYERYGYANVHLAQGRNAPRAYRHLPALRARNLPRRFLEHFDKARSQGADFRGSPVRRAMAYLVAAAIHTSYDWGAVRGAVCT
jgi:GT2 family glycosyltransferase